MKGRFYQALQQIISSNYYIYGVLMLFFIWLYFAPNAKSIIVFSLIIFIMIFIKLKDIIKTLFVMIILFLPFIKGKGFQITLIDENQTLYHIPYTFDFDITFWNIGLLFLTYALLRIRTKINQFTLELADVTISLFVLTAWLGITLSVYPQVSLLGFIEICTYILLFYVTISTKLNKKDMYLIIIILSFHVIFQGLWSSLQFLLKHPLDKAIEVGGLLAAQTDYIEWAAEDISFFRTTGTFNSANSLGSFMAAILPLILYQLGEKSFSWLEKTILYIAVILGFTGLILSASRTSWVILTILFFISYIFKYILKKNIIPQIHSNLKKLLIIQIIIFIPFIIIPRLDQLGTTFQEDGGFSYRIELIQKAILIAKTNPLGIGLGMFPKTLIEDIGNYISQPAQVHNLAAQIIAETGVLGILFFVFFLILLFRMYAKKTQWTNISKGLLASVITILFISNAYPFLLRSNIFPFLWLFLGLLRNKNIV
jgi:O-antigen ligase